VLLPRAVEAGVAYVPGSTFFPQGPAEGGHAHTLRLSFVTVPPARIAEGIAALGAVLRSA
jgi:2-aminoadipate transaminase